MATTLKGFSERGWDVTVIVDAPGTGGDVEGLNVVREPSAITKFRLYRACDVVLTQLGSRNRSIRWSTLVNRPIVLFLRMGFPDTKSMLRAPDLIVFNAQWLRQASQWAGPSIVQRPPVDPAEYRTDPGDAITLVNLSDRKGGPVLVELARRCPDLQFLGVRGAWGQQLDSSVLGNLAIIDPVSDMREVYRCTRVLLMPSSEEPFGRVGIEAACSGIPVIATPLPGIREALGDAALYARRDDLDHWERHLRSLQEPDRWAVHSQKAFERAEYWASLSEINEVIDAIALLANTPMSAPSDPTSQR